MKPRTACLFYEHCSCNVPVSFCSICEGAPACDDHALVDMVRELQPVLVGKSLSASQMGQFGVLYIFNNDDTLACAQVGAAIVVVRIVGAAIQLWSGPGQTGMGPVR